MVVMVAKQNYYQKHPQWLLNLTTKHSRRRPHHLQHTMKSPTLQHGQQYKEALKYAGATVRTTIICIHVREKDFALVQKQRLPSKQGDTRGRGREGALPAAAAPAAPTPLPLPTPTKSAIILNRMTMILHPQSWNHSRKACTILWAAEAAITAQFTRLKNVTIFICSMPKR